MSASAIAIESGGSYIDLPQPSYRGYASKWTELVRADRNTLGFLIKERIATKFTIEVQWTNLTAEEKNLVLDLTEPNSFGVRFVDMMTDSIKYISASAGGMYRGEDLEINGWGWFDGTSFEKYDVKMTLIER